jgi:hypothetical protein
MLFAKPLASFVLLHERVPTERVHITPSLWGGLFVPAANI